MCARACFILKGGQLTDMTTSENTSLCSSLHLPVKCRGLGILHLLYLWPPESHHCPLHCDGLLPCADGESVKFHSVAAFSCVREGAGKCFNGKKTLRKHEMAPYSSSKYHFL